MGVTSRLSSNDRCIVSLTHSLSIADGNVAFQLFLKSEYCEENLEFWMACEEFRKVTSSAKLALRAQSIYEEFIKTEAPKEVNTFIKMQHYHLIS